MAEKKKGLSPQQMLEQGINAVLNTNPLTAPINVIRNTIPQVIPALREGGKVVNSAVDAVPGAKEVLNHPALGVVTTAVPQVGAILGVAGTASQVAGAERATNPFKGKDKNPAAPAQPALDPNGSNGSRGENRTGVTPVNGSFRTAVEQQQSSQSSQSTTEKPGARTNANGLVSYGKDLSSLNAFTKDFTGGYELTDIKSAFQSNDLEGAYQNGSNTISTDESKYTLPDGATPSNVGGKYTMDGVDTSIQNTGYQISDKSVPGTIGGNASDPQDGTSSKPDVAESIRTVRMERQAGRGSRRDPRNRGEDSDMFGGPEPSDASLVSPMYANSKRNEIRSTFLDFEGSSVKAAAAANAVAGFGKDSNANPRFNYGGELVNAKAGMEYQAKDAAMKGLDPTEFLDIKIKEVKDTQKDK